SYVAAFHHRSKRQKAGTAFYSVKTAKDCIEQISIIGALLQVNQLLTKAFKDFPRLYQKILENILVITKTHSTFLAQRQVRILDLITNRQHRPDRILHLHALY